MRAVVSSLLLVSCAGVSPRPTDGIAPVVVAAPSAVEAITVDAGALTTQAPPVPIQRCDTVQDADCERVRTPSELNAVVSSARAGFRRCYSKELETRPAFPARLQIRIAIAPSGAITSVSEDGSPLPDAALAACVIAVARKLEFAAASAESIVTVPVAFSPSSPDVH